MEKTSMVLGVDASVLDSLGMQEGLTLFDNEERQHFLFDLVGRDKVEEPFRYKERQAAEVDESFRQIIPYIVFVCRDKVFCYQRTKKQGEERLYGKMSVGIGGHLEDTDVATSDKTYYMTGMLREIQEEVVPGALPVEHVIVGLINDPATPVGRVHVGILHVVKLMAPRMLIKEDHNVSLGWKTLTDIDAEGLPAAEPWSLVVLQYLKSKLDSKKRCFNFEGAVCAGSIQQQVEDRKIGGTLLGTVDEELVTVRLPRGIVTAYALCREGDEADSTPPLTPEDVRVRNKACNQALQMHIAGEAFAPPIWNEIVIVSPPGMEFVIRGEYEDGTAAISVKHPELGWAKGFGPSEFDAVQTMREGSSLGIMTAEKRRLTEFLKKAEERGKEEVSDSGPDQAASDAGQDSDNASPPA